MGTKLLPLTVQVATPDSQSCYPGVDALISWGSNLPPLGSRWVAGWVAGCEIAIWLKYAANLVRGSKGSNFYKNLRNNRERCVVRVIEGEKAFRDNNVNNLLPLLPPLPLKPLSPGYSYRKPELIRRLEKGAA